MDVRPPSHARLQILQNRTTDQRTEVLLRHGRVVLERMQDMATNSQARRIRAEMRAQRAKITYARLKIKRLRGQLQPALRPYFDIKRQIREQKRLIREIDRNIHQLRKTIPPKPIALADKVADSLIQRTRCSVCHRTIRKTWAAWRWDGASDLTLTQGQVFCRRCVPDSGPDTASARRTWGGWTNIHYYKP